MAMITSNLARSGHPSRFFVSLATPFGPQTGLLADWVIMTDNLVTLLENKIERKLVFGRIWWQQTQHSSTLWESDKKGDLIQ